MSDTVYIATEDIAVAPNVYAFRRGDTVPASVVKSLKIEDKVASEKTKAAAAAKAPTATP